MSSRCLVFPCRPPADVGLKRRFLERLGESAPVLVPCSALTRSLLLELGKLFLLILPLVTAAVVALLLCEVGLQNNLGLANCFRIVPFVLPRALAYTVSASWMFTVCAVYGSAAASNEVLALQSLGISPLRLLRLPLAISACLAVPTAWLMDIGDSRAKACIEAVAIESATDTAYRNLRCAKSCGNKNVSIAVRDVQGTQLIQPVVFYTPPDSTRHVVATAESGELGYDPHTREMRVVLVNGSVASDDRATLRFPETFVIRLPLGSTGPKPIGHYATIWELPGAIAEQERFVRKLEEQLQRVTSDPETTPEAQRGLGQQLARERHRLFRLQTYPHRRWSQGFCCLSFTLFGWPLAVRLRLKDMYTTFFLAFMPVVLFFYPCEMLCAKNDGLPPYSLWLCHGALMLAGLCLFRKL